MVAMAKWFGSLVFQTTAYTVVGRVDLLPAGFVSVGNVSGAVKIPLFAASMVPQVGSQESDSGFGDWSTTVVDAVLGCPNFHCKPSGGAFCRSTWNCSV